MVNNYYVYALKDPRTKPAKIFYIGKGTGSRLTDHINFVDNTRKGLYIQEIIKSGVQMIISIIVDGLTEEQAFKIELELIACFGTIDNGGVLYNTLIPKIVPKKVNKNISVPMDAVMKAQLGLKLIKESIIALAEENPEGITNSDCAHFLGLQSDNEGRQQDYLSYSVLGLLLKAGTLKTIIVGNRRKYQKAN